MPLTTQLISVTLCLLPVAFWWQGAKRPTQAAVNMVGNPYAAYWTERRILVYLWRHVQMQQAVFSNIL